MKNTVILFFSLFIFSCSSNDNEDNEFVEPLGVNNTEEQHEAILNKKINSLPVIFNFGIQEDELETILSNLGYFLFSAGNNVMYLASNKEYGIYHVWVEANNGNFPIESYSVFVYENRVTEDVEEPFIIQQFFYENMPDFDNKPYYQVQITFDKVNDNSYTSVRNWVLELDEVTGNFKKVSDLKFVKERITQPNMIIEIGEYNSEGLNPVIFARFFENRIPFYAQ